MSLPLKLKKVMPVTPPGFTSRHPSATWAALDGQFYIALFSRGWFVTGRDDGAFLAPLPHGAPIAHRTRRDAVVWLYGYALDLGLVE